MQKRKIYIVTGPIQTGKTTRLFNFIKAKNSVDGILAPVVNNKRALFHISTKQLKILEAENPGEKTIPVGKYNFLKEVFEWANKKLLKSFNAKPEWLIIDEVGKLEFLNCSSNDLEELNLDEVVNLEFLDCSYNSLEELYIDSTKITRLYCSNNNLRNIDLNAQFLSTLDCSYNQLTELDLPYTTIGDFDCSGNAWDDEPEEVGTAYSVGSFGPFPIIFTRVYLLDKYDKEILEVFYYEGQEFDTQGPYSSLSEAEGAAARDFGSSDFGFFTSLEEAEEYYEEITDLSNNY